MTTFSLAGDKGHSIAHDLLLPLYYLSIFWCYEKAKHVMLNASVNLKLNCEHLHLPNTAC